MNIATMPVNLMRMNTSMFDDVVHGIFPGPGVPKLNLGQLFARDFGIGIAFLPKAGPFKTDAPILTSAMLKAMAEIIETNPNLKEIAETEKLGGLLKSFACGKLRNARSVADKLNKRMFELRAERNRLENLPKTRAAEHLHLLKVNKRLTLVVGLYDFTYMIAGFTSDYASSYSESIVGHAIHVQLAPTFGKKRTAKEQRKQRAEFSKLFALAFLKHYGNTPGEQENYH